MKEPIKPPKPPTKSRGNGGTPDEAIRRARQQAASDEKAVLRASAEKLAAILSRPKSEWWANLRNGDLTPGDQSALEQQLKLSQSAKPESKWSASGPGALKRFWGRSSHRMPLMIKRALIAAAICAPTITAILNTGSTVTVNSAGSLLFRFPDGSSGPIAFAVGDRVTMVHAMPFGRAARRWVDGVGYAYAPDT